MISALSSGLISSRQTDMPAPLTETPDFKLRAIAPIEPQKTMAADMRAAWLAAHPVISPAEAFASGAELGPPSGSGRADNQTKNIHTEIKVNGKVIARIYNTGGIEIADEYRFFRQDRFRQRQNGRPRHPPRTVPSGSRPCCKVMVP